MGIRTLHHRTAPARTGAGKPACVSFPPVPAFALGAGTARVPATRAAALRHTTADLRRRLAHHDRAAVRPRRTPVWRLWADLTRGYLALARTLIPRPGPGHTFTVFVAAADGVSGRPGGAAGCRRLPDHRRRPGPDATP